MAGGDLRRCAREGLSHLGENGIVRMAKVDAHEDLAGDDVAAIGRCGQEPDGTPTERPDVARDTINLADNVCGAKQRIAPRFHRRRAGMRILADKLQLVPAERLHAGYHADRLLFRFENGALLDVQFEEGGDRAPTHFILAFVTDALQLLAQRLSILVDPRLGRLHRDRAREDAG